MNQSVEEKIKQRRLQILVHSFIYYELNQNIISDDKWNRWAQELLKLQQDNPQIITDYQEEFEDWDGSTGAFFNYDAHIISVAHHLIKMHDKHTKKSVKYSSKAKKGRKLF